MGLEEGESRESTSSAHLPEGWRWRQGDVLIQLDSFVRKTVDAGGRLVVEPRPTSGGVIITQTCDLVRTRDKIPNVEIAALCRLDGAVAHEARSFRRPTYVPVPGAGNDAFADLGLLMTIDKAALSWMSPLRGCRDEFEAVRFANGVAHRWSRFAFPDDVVEILRPLKDRLDEKARKASPEGALIQLIEDVFVSAAPGWEAVDGTITLHFVVPEEATAKELAALAAQLLQWKPRVQSGSRRVELQSAKLSEVSALEYLTWRRLDYDFISP